MVRNRPVERRAIVAGSVLAAVIGLALLGPLLAPHPPGEVVDMPYGPARGATRWAPTTSAPMC